MSKRTLERNMPINQKNNEAIISKVAQMISLKLEADKKKQNPKGKTDKK